MHNRPREINILALFLKSENMTGYLNTIFEYVKLLTFNDLCVMVSLIPNCN